MISWIANTLAVIGWLVNIKYRKQAMIIFTVATILSLVYFWDSHQMPFVYRFLLYLGIDIVTLCQIFRSEKNENKRKS